jgi:hypothetical protein
MLQIQKTENSLFEPWFLLFLQSCIFHLAEGIQRRRLKCEKLTDDRRHTTDDGCQVMAKGDIIKTC